MQHVSGSYFVTLCKMQHVNRSYFVTFCFIASALQAAGYYHTKAITDIISSYKNSQQRISKVAKAS
uniref:Uncharacterized protein n=1 Tax=Arundo donax TaxID=35708 RepID=A0A0A9E2I1_ARUDO